VQETALTVLEQRQLGDEALRALTEASGGALPHGNDHLLVSVLARYLSRSDVQEALKRISARNPGDADLQSRVVSLLQSASVTQ
jgi:hypothetical protein